MTVTEILEGQEEMIERQADTIKWQAGKIRDLSYQLMQLEQGDNPTEASKGGGR